MKQVSTTTSSQPQTDLEAALARAVVVDGVTIGHPCCAIHDCKEPLPNSKARYCLSHKDEANKCRVSDCHSRASDGFETCSNSECRKAEQFRKASGKAMFQLKNRVSAQQRLVAEHLKMVAEADLDDTDMVIEILESGEMRTEDCEGKADTGNMRKKIIYGRRHTHNEEFCVACCGVILGRATMYGSEAPNGVRVSYHYCS